MVVVAVHRCRHRSSRTRSLVEKDHLIEKKINYNYPLRRTCVSTPPTIKSPVCRPNVVFVGVWWPCCAFVAVVVVVVAEVVVAVQVVSVTSTRGDNSHMGLRECYRRNYHHLCHYDNNDGNKHPAQSPHTNRHHTRTTNRGLDSLSTKTGPKDTRRVFGPYVSFFFSFMFFWY